MGEGGDGGQMAAVVMYVGYGGGWRWWCMVVV